MNMLTHDIDQLSHGTSKLNLQLHHTVNSDNDNDGQECLQIKCQPDKFRILTLYILNST